MSSSGFCLFVVSGNRGRSDPWARRSPWGSINMTFSFDPRARPRRKTISSGKSSRRGERRTKKGQKGPRNPSRLSLVTCPPCSDGSSRKCSRLSRLFPIDKIHIFIRCDLVAQREGWWEGNWVKTKNNLEARRGEGGMETNSSDTINLSGAERRKIVIVISNKYFAC